MKKLIMTVFMVFCCLLFIHVNVEGADTLQDKITITVGEKYVIPGYSSNGAVLGSSVSIKKGVITAKKPGKSTVNYIDDENELKVLSVNVKKSGIEVVMLDIGQGDAFLVRVNGINIIIDTGEKGTYGYLKQQLDHFEVSKVDMLIISHMDTDHMGAAQLLCQEYNVPKVLMPNTPGNSNEYHKLMNYIDRERIDAIYVQSGEKYGLGKGCALTILGVDLGEGTNDSSIVMKLKYYSNTFLFTGDASSSVLNQIMESSNISADVIKIPHHGSDSSSPILFLKKTGAQYALISTGRDNMYGHPTANVIRRLELLKTSILRTDLDGTVTVKGTGKKISVSKEQIIDWDAEERLQVETGNIIGNIRSKVYHKSDCMSLPLEKNRVYFNSVEDAEMAGYRKCGNCIK